MTLEDRLAELLAEGRSFTADDLTDNGRIAVDIDHTPNGGQSAIGSWFVRWQRRGWIEPTGEVVRSRAPHRKGGGIRVWVGTAEGLRWALDRQQARLF